MAGFDETQVKQVISEQLNVDLEQVVPGANLTDDLGADSLDGVELIMALEERFSIDIPDREAVQVITVQDAILLVRRKITA